MSAEIVAALETMRAYIEVGDYAIGYEYVSTLDESMWVTRMYDAKSHLELLAVPYDTLAEALAAVIADEQQKVRA